MSPFTGVMGQTRLVHTRSLPEQITQAHGAIKVAVQRARALGALGEELLSVPMPESEFLALVDSQWKGARADQRERPGHP